MNIQMSWGSAFGKIIQHDSNKCVGTWPELLSRTFTATMVFMMQACFMMTASPRTNPKLFLVLVKNIRMQLLSATFKQYDIGRAT